MVLHHSAWVDTDDGDGDGDDGDGDDDDIMMMIVSVEQRPGWAEHVGSNMHLFAQPDGKWPLKVNLFLKYLLHTYPLVI